jgi:propionate CoA-transferase
VANRIEAYNLPQGVITHLFRDIAAGKPGTLTRVGLGTFVDPRFGGGKLNAHHRRSGPPDGDRRRGIPVLQGLPDHVGIIRGTTADPDGNITMEKEALTLEARPSPWRPATAAASSSPRSSASPSAAPQPAPGEDPRHLVDCVVVAEKPEYHMQTFIEQYSPAFSGEIKVPMSAIAPMPMSERKIIARRAAMELTPTRW